MLFAINEATLSKWYKKKTRCNEVKMLLQGIPKLPSRATAVEPLPPALERCTSAPQPSDNPHIFHEAEDRAYVRAAPSTSVLTSDIPATTSTPSRTTEWRHRKAAATEEVQNLPILVNFNQHIMDDLLPYRPQNPGRNIAAESAMNQ